MSYTNGPRQITYCESNSLSVVWPCDKNSVSLSEVHQSDSAAIHYHLQVTKGECNELKSLPGQFIFSLEMALVRKEMDSN